MKDKETKPAKKVPDLVSYLWADLTLEQQRAELEEAAVRLAREEHRPPPGKGLRSGYKPFEELDEFYKEMEVVFGLNLDDGWYRLCALHQFEGFIFYGEERYQADYLKTFSKNYKATRDMKIWPKGARSKTFPWKFASIYEVELVQIRWHEEHRQYKAVIEKAPGVTQTFWFPPQFRDSSLAKGWIKPRYVSKFHPWHP